MVSWQTGKPDHLSLNLKMGLVGAAFDANFEINNLNH